MYDFDVGTESMCDFHSHTHTIRECGSQGLHWTMVSTRKPIQSGEYKKTNSSQTKTQLTTEE